MWKCVIFILVLAFLAVESVSAQKSDTKGKGITMGLSYRVYEFYAEDYAIAPDMLTDGKWADGLLGIDFGYQTGFNKFIGFALDYRFLIGAFQRGFDYYAHASNPADPAFGHQFFAGPSINFGKGVFNISFKAQAGYDYLKVKGKADLNYTVTARSNVVYVGESSPWINWLNNYNREAQVEISRTGYPDYKRNGFLYQLGTNINFSGENATFTIYGNYCPVKYNGIKHEEYDIGMGAIIHF